MNLFNKEKELILKITNGILLVWILAAFIFMGSYIIDVIYPDIELSFDEYKVSYCRKYDDEDELEFETECEYNYESYKLNNKETEHYQIKYIYTSALNIIVVGTGLFIINRKKQSK